MQYMGGKSRIANVLAGEFNSVIMNYGIEHYIEPFVGGAAVIELVNCNNKLGNDINHYQIALIEHIKQGGNFPDYISREEWKAVRDNKDNYPEWYIAFIGIVGSFNGRWFEGYGGEIIDKDGGMYNRAMRFKNQLYNTNEVSKLQSVQLKCGDYRHIEIPKRSIVYCDPPYANAAGYKDKFDSKAFYDWAIETSKHSLVYISEYMMPSNNFFEIKSMKLNKSLSIKEEAQDITERLFVIKGGWLVNELYGNKAVGYDIDF